MNADAIKRTICDGVSAGKLGLATKNEGQLKLDRFDEAMSEAEVEISDEVFVLKAEDAQKLLEPPQLAQLAIHPQHVTLKPGEQASFTCSGVDQYGQPFKVLVIEWTATGGSIDESGLYSVPTDGNEGQYLVRGTGDGVEAIAEVRISKEKKLPPPPPPPDKRVVSWSGAVTPQKWMNFYTKVLSRFASSPDLKLKVNFQVILDNNEAESKADEARTGLKELGLDDDVNVT